MFSRIVRGSVRPVQRTGSGLLGGAAAAGGASVLARACAAAGRIGAIEATAAALTLSTSPVGGIREPLERRPEDVVAAPLGVDEGNLPGVEEGFECCRVKAFAVVIP